MKFGVISCQKCHRALGINLRFKNTTCPYCNFKMAILPDNIQYKTNSEHDLASIISKINQQLFEQTDEIERNKPKKTLNFDNLDLGNLTSDFKDGRDSNETVYEQLDPYKRIQIKYKDEKVSISLLEKVIIDLGRELGEFTVQDFKELIHVFAFNEDKIDEYLDQLKNLNIIYEPRPGKYKIIED